MRQLFWEVRELMLGGQFKEFTIYFLDVVGFMFINESMYLMEMVIWLG